MTVLMVTHNAVLAEMADRVVRMRSGHVTSDDVVEAPADADTLVW